MTKQPLLRRCNSTADFRVLESLFFGVRLVKLGLFVRFGVAIEPHYVGKCQIEFVGKSLNTQNRLFLQGFGEFWKWRPYWESKTVLAFSNSAPNGQQSRYLQGFGRCLLFRHAARRDTILT